MQAFIELKAKRLVPMHYGTFRLSYEPLHEPPARLLAVRARAWNRGQVSFMTEGQPMVFLKSSASAPPFLKPPPRKKNESKKARG